MTVYPAAPPRVPSSDSNTQQALVPRAILSLIRAAVASGQAEDRDLVSLHSADSQAGPVPQMKQLLWTMGRGLETSAASPCCPGTPSCEYQPACLLVLWEISRGPKGPSIFTSSKCNRLAHGQEQTSCLEPACTLLTGTERRV